MESQGGGVELGSGGLWWGLCGGGQLALGIAAYRRGCSDSFMPIKAFAIATLFVGAGASAVGGALYISGIKQVDDMVQAGQNLRKILGLPPRNQS